MSIFQKIPSTVRQYIYVIVTVVVAVLVALGILDKSVLENISDTIAVIGGILLGLTTLMASLNVTKPEPPPSDEVITDATNDTVQ